MSTTTPAPSAPPGPSGRSRPSTAVTVARLAALFAFGAVALGSVVCATDSGASCPTWPGCRTDAIAPPWSLAPIIEFTHRVVAMSTGPLVLAAAVLVWRLRTRDLAVRVLPWLALAGAAASGVFGRLVVVSHIPTWAGAVDLGCALLCLTLLAVVAVRVDALESVGSGQGTKPRRDPRTATLAVSALVAVLALHVSGIFAAGKGSYTRCLGWPLFRRVAADPHHGLSDARLALAVLAGGLVLATAAVCVRGTRLRGFGVALTVLIGVEFVLGLVLRGQGVRHLTAAGYSVTAVAIVWCLGLLVAQLLTGRATIADGEGVGPREPALVG